MTMQAPISVNWFSISWKWKLWSSSLIRLKVDVCIQMWCFVVPIPYLCPLSNFDSQDLTPCDFSAHLSRRHKMSYCDPSSVCRLSINFFFKCHLVLKLWSKFNLTLHECFPRSPLSKLHKWFCSTEQEANKSSR